MSTERAIVIGGFSESSDQIAPLTNELATTLFSDIEQLTWCEAYRRGAKLAQDVLDRTVITHSAGAIFARDGMRAITLSGPEPTHPAMSIARAGLVALNTRFIQKSEVALSVLECAEEIVRHPDHLRILAHVGMFSTAERLIRSGAARFPEGRYYLPSAKDEFGFTRKPTIERASSDGIVTDYVGTYHNDPVTQPRATAARIKDILENSNSTLAA